MNIYFKLLTNESQFYKHTISSIYHIQEMSDLNVIYISFKNEEDETKQTLARINIRLPE